MTLVWDNFNRGGSEKLAMLALADWCDDKGGSLFPSINTIGKKINVSEKQARRIVHKFIDDGFVSVIGNHHGGGKGDTRHYQINLNKLTTPPTHGSPPIDVTPPTHGSTPLPPMSLTPPTHGSQTINNHHITIIGDLWNQFIAMRIKIKKPMTEHAKELMLKKIEKMHSKNIDVVSLLEKSIINSWTDIYAPKTEKQDSQFEGII